jgi:diadenosine tetraphosphatase ApaH/serine/threonine PP2A family protein phosphatase
VIAETAEAARESLGEERIAWLQALPRAYHYWPLALVHASPDSPWRAPAHDASEQELRSTYGPLGTSMVVHGHIHRPYIRTISEMIVANSGSVGLPYDGDPRASYLLLDDPTPEIRRVPYDIDREIRALQASGMPHADWIARILKSASFVMP